MTILKTHTSPAPTIIGGPSEARQNRTAGQLLELAFPEPKAGPGAIDVTTFVRSFSDTHDLADEIRAARKELAAITSNPLAAMRLERGLSQRDLAQRATTSQAYISQLEGGGRDPGTDMIQRLAAALSQAPEAILHAVICVRRAHGAWGDE